MNYSKNMLLVKGIVRWSGNGKATFKLIPLSDDCPFLEAVFDPDDLALGLIGKFKKSEYEMVPALDEDGEPKKKKKAVTEGGIPIKLERRMLEKWNEWEILTKEEIVSFIKMVAINADTFDVESWFNKAEADNKRKEEETTTASLPAANLKATVTENPMVN